MYMYVIILVLDVFIYVDIHFHLPIRLPGKQYPNICHSLDVWHKAKKLVKALTELQFVYATYMYVLCKYVHVYTLKMSAIHTSS